MSISPVVAAAMTARNGGVATSSYTAQVDQYVGVIADGSKASDDDKLTAYKWLYSTLSSATLYNNGSVPDLEKAVDAFDNSAFAKKVRDVGDRYMNMGMSEGRTAQAKSRSDDEFVGSNPIANFSRFSEDDQKLLFVALGLQTKYSSIDEAYDDFQRQSDEVVAQYNASKKPAVEVSLSDAAKTLLGPDAVAQATGSPAEQALARLKAGARSTDKGVVALTMLRSAAEGWAAAKTEADDRKAVDAGDVAPRSPLAPKAEKKQGPYEAGDNVDKSA